MISSSLEKYDEQTENSQKQIEFCKAAGTVRHGADRRQVTRAGKQLFDQLPHRQGTGQLAVNLHILQKRCKARVAAMQHRRIQAAAHIRLVISKTGMKSQMRSSLLSPDNAM